MKKLWVRIGIIVVVVVVLAIILFGTQTKKEPEEIKIGAVLPLTGNLARFGEWMKNGIDMAVVKINAEGRINGKEVRIIYEDSKGEANVGLAAFEKLAHIDKVRIIFTAITPVTLAMIPKANQERILLITGSTHPNVTKKGNLTIRNYPTAAQEASFMAKFAFSKLGLKKIAVLYQNDDAWNAYKDVVVNEYNRLGGVVVSVESYEKDTNDFRTLLLKAQKHSPEALYLGSWIEAGTIFRQAREMGLKCQVIGSNSLSSPDVLAIAGKAAEGVIFTTPEFDPSSKDKIIAFFVKSYKEKYGEIPAPLVPAYYDTMMMLATVLRHDKIDDPSDIRRSLISIKAYQGIMGSLSFEEDGSLQIPMTIKTIKEGQIVKYKQVDI